MSVYSMTMHFICLALMGICALCSFSSHKNVRNLVVVLAVVEAFFVLALVRNDLATLGENARQDLAASSQIDLAPFLVIDLISFFGTIGGFLNVVRATPQIKKFNL